MMFFLLFIDFIVLYSIITTSTSAVVICNTTNYTEISISKNGSDTTNCGTSDHYCATLHYVLTNSGLLKNCTRINLYDNQTLNSSVIIRNINGLIIQGGSDLITVRCDSDTSNDPAIGIELINCTDVQLLTIEWINCEINSNFSQLKCHFNQYHMSTNMIGALLPQTFSNLPPTKEELVCESATVMLGENIITDDYLMSGFKLQLFCILNGTENSCNGLYEVSRSYKSQYIIITGVQFSSIETLVLNWLNINNNNEITKCLNISIIAGCRLGFIYNETQRQCVCYSGSEDVLVCVNGTACIKSGYWYGQVDKYYAAYPCPYGYCNYTTNHGLCPAESCEKEGAVYEFFCKVPKVSDDLCLFNRGGELCSKCQENYYLSFDGIRCVHKTDCHRASILLYFTIFLVFWFLLVLVIVIVVKLDLRIGSGQLYCLVFFFSVLQYFVRGSFPSNFLYVVELITSGFMQLDPKIFGLFKLCLPYQSISNLEYTALRFINPLFLIFIISLFICASRKWTFFTGHNNAINMICIVIYLVFISLTQTSLALLTPVKYPGIDHVYVSLEPNVTYFSPKRHLPYAVVAILIQLIFVIPFLFLLIFAPCLIRIRALNLTRIKPILDEFQACYKEQYRSFAGFYLAFRQLIFILSLFAISIGVTTYIYILQILSILILTIHCLVQPYKSLFLNVLDGLLILDLVLLSILHGSTANVVFDDIPIVKTLFVYILVLLPVLCFLVMCFLRFAQFTILKFNPSCFGIKQKRQSTLTNKFIKSTTIEINERESIREREPLLFHTEMNNSTNYDRANDGISTGLVQQPHNVVVVDAS